MNELADLVRLSRFAGERFDLVQAGGGNASIKTADGFMTIKASGVSMSDMNLHHGHTTLNVAALHQIFAEAPSLQAMSRAVRDRVVCERIAHAGKPGTPRPSIETLLHAVLGKFVLHTHPLAVNMIACRKDWQTVFRSIFPESILVEYHTPGLDLALALCARLRETPEASRSETTLIFLQQHGMIVSSEDSEGVLQTTEAVTDRLERWLAVDLSAYRIVSDVSRYVNRLADEPRVSYLSQDEELRRLLDERPELFDTRPFCPDMAVYNGPAIHRTDKLSDVDGLMAYVRRYGELPRVIVHKSEIFLVATSLRKAREMESVLKFHLLVLKHSPPPINSLDDSEIAYLGNWEAEQYRRKL